MVIEFRALVTSFWCPQSLGSTGAREVGSDWKAPQKKSMQPLALPVFRAFQTRSTFCVLCVLGLWPMWQFRLLILYDKYCDKNAVLTPFLHTQSCTYPPPTHTQYASSEGGSRNLTMGGGRLKIGQGCLVNSAFHSREEGGGSGVCSSRNVLILRAHFLHLGAI